MGSSASKPPRYERVPSTTAYPWTTQPRRPPADALFVDACEMSFVVRKTLEDWARTDLRHILGAELRRAERERTTTHAHLSAFPDWAARARTVAANTLPATAPPPVPYAYESLRQSIPAPGSLAPGTYYMQYTPGEGWRTHALPTAVGSDGSTGGTGGASTHGVDPRTSV